MQKTLLIIAHAPSDNTRAMLNAVSKGANDQLVDNIKVRVLTPLETQANDIISADAIIIGTTENLGYMSGLVKDVFDRCFYDCLEKTNGLAFTFFIRAGNDGTGTKKAIESITTGLKWRLVQAPLICTGDFKPEFLDQCEKLGLKIAASLDADII